MVEHFTYTTFAERQGELFEIHLGADAVVPLELVEAIDRPPAGETGDGRGESFSLVFRGPRDRPLHQATYQFAHDQLGRFPLFIVPIGMEQDGMRYEAVFTRLPPQGTSTP